MFYRLEEAFDRVKCTKLMQNLKVNRIDWRETRLNKKLYMDQSVNLKLDQGGDKKGEDWKRS
jgi:hypothetical protein